MNSAMNHEERQLISDLFGRMQQFGTPEKDRDAEQLIAQSVRANPDAPYMLVQSVLVQDNALQQADQRIQDLEARVQQLESTQRAAPAAASGGFLGGMFGGGRAAAQPARHLSSVPNTGRPVVSPPANSPWGRQAGQAGAQAPMQQQAASGGGGFMKTAMATAAGVAGGMLLANSIQGMMNPGANGAQAANNTPTDATTGEPQEAARSEPQYQDPNDNDPGNTDTAYDDSGSDFGGGDFDA
jgi:uncharacterized protein